MTNMDPPLSLFSRLLLQALAPRKLGDVGRVLKRQCFASAICRHVLLTGPSWLFGAVPEHHPKVRTAAGRPDERVERLE